MVIKKACIWSHAYKDVWHLIVSDESLICEQEETNEYDRNVASIMFENCMSEMFVEHVPFSAGFDLEMLVDYIF